MRSYIQAQVRQGELLQWRLLVCCAQDSSDKPSKRSSLLGREDLRITGYDTVGLINRWPAWLKTQRRSASSRTLPMSYSE